VCERKLTDVGGGFTHNLINISVQSSRSIWVFQTLRVTIVGFSVNRWRRCFSN